MSNCLSEHLVHRQG